MGHTQSHRAKLLAMTDLDPPQSQPLRFSDQDAVPAWLSLCMCMLSRHRPHTPPHPRLVQNPKRETKQLCQIGGPHTEKFHSGKFGTLVVHCHRPHQLQLSQSFAATFAPWSGSTISQSLPSAMYVDTLKYKTTRGSVGGRRVEENIVKLPVPLNKLSSVSSPSSTSRRKPSLQLWHAEFVRFSGPSIGIPAKRSFRHILLKQTKFIQRHSESFHLKEKQRPSSLYEKNTDLATTTIAQSPMCPV